MLEPSLDCSIQDSLGFGFLKLLLQDLPDFFRSQRVQPKDGNVAAIRQCPEGLPIVRPQPSAVATGDSELGAVRAAQFRSDLIQRRSWVRGTDPHFI